MFLSESPVVGHKHRQQKVLKIFMFFSVHSSQTEKKQLNNGLHVQGIDKMATELA